MLWLQDVHPSSESAHFDVEPAGPDEAKWSGGRIVESGEGGGLRAAWGGESGGAVFTLAS
jgi:hypothetical protein